MKIVVTTVLSAFICFGFSSCETKEVENDKTVTDEVVLEEEVVEEVEEVTQEQLILGNWEYNYEMDGNNIEFLLTINEGGSYSQSMAGNVVDGTWELKDDEHMVVKNPHIKNPDGQTWKIVKATDNELHIDWNVGGDEAKVMEFERVNN